MDATQIAIAERVAEEQRHHKKAQFKAALIIGFFMHLRYEISRMKWITMCSVVACLILMTIFFFPDAHRIITLGVK
ncbi:MAG: hypothetical protein DMG42_20280 [Acidobacteria bacterium]|nr:MAG: hypothetical protein DMG42_20280 [Acidobacteriota bacterium]